MAQRGVEMLAEKEKRSISRAGQTPGRRPSRASCSASRADCQRRLTVRSETPRTAAAQVKG